MNNLSVNPTLADGDLLELSPLRQPNSILKPSQKDNLIMLQTPVHKNLKVSFITPQRTPLPAHASKIRQPSTSAPHRRQNSSTSFPDINSNTSLCPSTSSEEKVGVATENVGVSASKKDVQGKNEKWEVLRQLDENLRWRERVEVITKLDHVEYGKFAREYLDEMIRNAVNISEARNIAGQQVREQTMCHDLEYKKTSKEANMNVLSNNVYKSEQEENIEPKLTIENSSDRQKNDGDGTENENSNQPDNNLSLLIDVSNPDDGRKESGILKPTSVKRQQNLTNARSSSVSCVTDEGTKHTFSMGKKSYSFDLDDIPEDRASSGALLSAKEDTNKTQIDTTMSQTRSSRLNAGKSGSNDLLNLSNSDFLSESTIPLDSSVFSTPGQAYQTAQTTFLESDFVDGKLALAQGQLDLDYLEQLTSGDVANTLRKQSLFLKFDPLLEDISPRRSMVLMGRKSDIIDFTSRVTPQPEENADDTVLSPREPDLLCDSPSELNATENIAFDVSKCNRGSTNDSVSSASPGIPNSAGSKPDIGIVEVLKYSEADVQKILRRRREKWLKEKEAADARCQKMEEEVEQKNIICNDYRSMCDNHFDLVDREKEKTSKEMTVLQEERKKLDKCMSSLTKVSNMIFKRSEALQKTLSNLQANELKLKEHTKNVRMKFSASQKNILDLEKQLEETLKSNEVERSTADSKIRSQLGNLQVKVKSLELKGRTYQANLDQKQKEIKELTVICDELVSSAEAAH